MASQADILSLAASILGKPAITSITDNSNVARVFLGEYDMLRRALLRGRATWRFSIKRAKLPALTAAPVSGPYTTQYALPTDCLRILLAGDTWPGMDLSDYRQGPTDAGYTLEGRNILCDYGGPLSLKYVGDITDTTLFDPWFCIYLAAELAWTSCERLTGSDTKKEEANKRKENALVQAANSNALENPSEHLADNEWILARLQ